MNIMQIRSILTIRSTNFPISEKYRIRIFVKKRQCLTKTTELQQAVQRLAITLSILRQNCPKNIKL